MANQYVIERGRCLLCNRKFEHGLHLRKHLMEDHGVSKDELAQYESVYHYMLAATGRRFYCRKCGKELSIVYGKILRITELCGQCASRDEERNRRIAESLRSRSPEEKARSNLKRKLTCLAKYGYEASSQAPEVKAKARATIRRTWAERHDEIIEKRTQTCLRKYGVDNPFRDREKIRAAVYAKYGVTHPAKLPEVKQKISRSSVLAKAKRNITKVGGKAPVRWYKGIPYQGSFELDFLRWCERNHILEFVSRGPSIFYIDVEGKLRVHRVDFRIGDLLIEIKSEYTYETDKNVEAKRCWAVRQGHEYILIINKDYTELEHRLFQEVF